MNTIPELLEDIKNGKMVVLVDDEDRENEGDLVMASDFVTPADINFMTTEARGLVCLAMTREQVERLEIPLMVGSEANKSPNMTAFTVSIEAATGVTTGISVDDRARTIQVAADPKSSKKSIISPGHIFPIQAQPGGVLKRAGHTEGSIDLALLAGRTPSATICEIMNADGSMARVPELKKFAEKHCLKIGTIEDLIKYRVETELFVEKTESAELHTKWGKGFKIIGFKNRLDGREHLAIVKGDLAIAGPVLVRMHGESLLSDVFKSSVFGGSDNLDKALQKIEAAGRGVLVYVRQENNRGDIAAQIAQLELLSNKSNLEEITTGEYMKDKRDYGVGAQILRALGVKKVNLLSNSTSKRVGLKGYGIEILGRVPLHGLARLEPVGANVVTSVHFDKSTRGKELD